LKFVFLVEGDTESKVIAPFLKRWLDTRLRQKVGIKTVRFRGWSDLVKHLPKKASMYLDASYAQDVIAVVGLLDLYGPTIYPDSCVSAEERMDWAVKKLAKDVGDDRFRVFFAVHEVESWLLSDPRIFPRAVGRALRDKAARPESVNFDEPPSILLDKLYRENQGRKYKKVTHGYDLFGKLDPDRVYEACPTFRKMMDELLTLAASAIS